MRSASRHRSGRESTFSSARGAAGVRALRLVSDRVTLPIVRRIVDGAFALFDRGTGQLLIARDPLGEKPMHLAWLSDGTLAFGSELAALMALPEIARRIDPAAMEDVLALGYIPDPATIYAGIRRLPAAHFPAATHAPPRVFCPAASSNTLCPLMLTSFPPRRVLLAPAPAGLASCLVYASC